MKNDTPDCLATASFFIAFIKAHDPELRRAVLAAAGNKTRFRRNAFHVSIEDGYQEALILCSTGRCRQLPQCVQPIIAIDYEVRHVFGAEQSSRFWEAMLTESTFNFPPGSPEGSHQDLPALINSARETIRRLVGYIASVIFNLMRTWCRNELHRSQIIAVNSKDVLVFGSRTRRSDHTESEALAKLILCQASAETLIRIVKEYGEDLRKPFEELLLLHLIHGVSIDAVLEQFRNDSGFTFPFSRMSAYRYVREIKARLANGRR